MKIVHVVPSLEGGYGVAVVIDALAQRQAAFGHDVTVMSLGEPSHQTRKGVYYTRFERDHPPVRIVSKLGCSRALRAGIRNASPQIVHAHGLWMMPSVYAEEATRARERTFVLSPHGMLGHQCLQFSRIPKFLFSILLQNRTLNAVSVFHATCDAELRDIRARGFEQPVAVIPAGIDLPHPGEFASAGDTSANQSPFVLYVGRIHPIKGLHRLISAFAAVAPRHPRWRLRLVGPDEAGHTADLARQISAVGLTKQISIEPPVFGAAKYRLMHGAQLFAVPSLHENFGLTIAESLAVEVPVIATVGTPWKGLVNNRCGWWIDHSIEAMADALAEAMALSPKTRRQMGMRGRAWMQCDFDWGEISSKMTSVYEWLDGTRERPDCVRLS